ncbi:recombinase RecT [Virgibacillus pantothenticus]|uniref:RecT family recombinase n=1 Tax=Virgibacillus pantothenticus TaxID=1473 RepID=UPI001C23E9E9|nr:RecT family recombinase [Virgibacillus pantothenticus]MBU8567609.1 recombinase RecT [Virgibacillus pantothenticus]MBU8601397.1 recombinase RecT [Virgibacillus pantothenticus]MBU8636214.1 recombinase RecT [Virgibacillus pantothenticus]MBU8643734.1 recombinase RecT [Virgibacillus pantothenticus]MBU8648010.1 recombinase RecT [Virgibacillus pantothenticus]
MANQIVATNTGELTQEDVQTLKHTIAKDLNDSQFKLFLSMCEKTGANPIVNEIHPSVFKGQMTVQFGYDFYIRKAKEADGYLGYDIQLIHENDEFKVGRKTDDSGRSYMAVEQHEVTFPRGKVIGGYAIAYREGVTPFMVLMEVDEVDHLRKSNIGMQKTMWNNYFSDMFKKHILKRALKSQFGLEFDDQPVEATNEIPKYKPGERKDITPNQEVVEQPKEEQEDKMAGLRHQMKQKFVQLGITDNAGINAYLEKHQVKFSTPPTEAELIGAIELLDMHLELQQAKASSDDELPE